VNALLLDIDGVLNSADYMLRRKHLPRPTRHNIDALTVPRLNAITDRSGAVLVISSTWRIGHPVRWLAEALRMHGVTGRVIDRTPSCYFDLPGGGCKRHERGVEIQAWLDRQPVACRPDQFVILDDESDMAHLRHRLVKTTWALGLLDEHVEQCVEMFNPPHKEKIR
jgi:hypothetical protein